MRTDETGATGDEHLHLGNLRVVIHVLPTHYERFDKGANDVRFPHP